MLWSLYRYCHKRKLSVYSYIIICLYSINIIIDLSMIWMWHKSKWDQRLIIDFPFTLSTWDKDIVFVPVQPHIIFLFFSSIRSITAVKTTLLLFCWLRPTKDNCHYIEMDFSSELIVFPDVLTSNALAFDIQNILIPFLYIFFIDSFTQI